MSRKRNCGGVKVFFIGSLLGGLIGSTTALLFAPKEGKKLRRELAKKCCDISEKAQDIACEAKERCSEVMDCMIDFAEETKKKIRRK